MHLITFFMLSEIKGHLYNLKQANVINSLVTLFSLGINQYFYLSVCIVELIVSGVKIISIHIVISTIPRKYVSK